MFYHKYSLDFDGYEINSLQIQSHKKIVYAIYHPKLSEKNANNEKLKK